MCYKGQLELINFLLCTFIVSALLACGKWNQGNGTKGIALFSGEMYREKQSRQCGSGPALRLHVPDRAEILGDAVTGTSVLPYFCALQAFLFVWGEQAEVKQGERMVPHICWLFWWVSVWNSANTVINVW